MTTTREVAHVRVDGHGRVVIPAYFREALGLESGDKVTLILEDGGITRLTIRETVRRVQDEVAKYVTPGRSLVDELIAERRAEFEREEGEIREARERRSQRHAQG